MLISKNWRFLRRKKLKALGIQQFIKFCIEITEEIVKIWFVH